MRRRQGAPRLASIIILAAFLFAAPIHHGTARAQALTCFSFFPVAGNYSGVGISQSFGRPVSTFSFLAINSFGGVAIFSFFNNGAGVGGLTSFFTGTATIITTSPCLLVGTVFDSASGSPVTFVAKPDQFALEMNVSTPFDPFAVFTGTFQFDSL